MCLCVCVLSSGGKGFDKPSRGITGFLLGYIGYMVNL